MHRAASVWTLTAECARTRVYYSFSLVNIRSALPYTQKGLTFRGRHWLQ